MYNKQVRNVRGAKFRVFITEDVARFILFLVIIVSVGRTHGRGIILAAAQKLNGNVGSKNVYKFRVRSMGCAVAL